ncbi:carabin isoform X2 [Desmodus rotundus]|uniref:carabin isoform X2 n=1 Tax=Desmodus rotundus TaxID=9430 RepID=UPI0023818B09|nr:carabin isoform X2 [Desmodus rotundus]
MAQALGEDLVQPCELQDDSSSLGSDSELSGPGPYRQADRYGFIGGSSAEPGPGCPSVDLIRQREMKWVEMTSHWEKTMSRRYKKVKMQCRKGIPSALRARCWPLLCGAHVCQKNSPGTYQELAEAPGDPQWMETIGRDLHRQFPLHEMFVSPQGHGRVSCRYSRPTPCIGRNRVTARPRALWLLCYLCTCPQRRPSGAWCRSVSFTCLATTGRTWRPCGWTLRCSWPCCGGCSLACTSTCSRWALGPCSTCPSGSCASSPAPCLSPRCCVSGMPSSVRVHGVALSEQDLQREIKTQLAQLPESTSGPPPRPKARLAGAQAIFEAQQLAGVRGGTRPEVPRIVVQPPEEPRPPRRKPQTRGKTFHGLLTRSKGPPIEGPPRSHRGSTSFLDTRF